MRKWLQKLASSTSPYSLAAKFRKKRFLLFHNLLASTKQTSVTILDVGGREEFWVNQGMAGTNHKITVLNIHPIETHYENLNSMVGDARNLKDFDNKSVDIVFSNSVIEHLGTFDNQRQMADEIERVGNNYFVQTPSYYFPMEPHFLFPFFHWLPRYVRVFLVQHLSLGWYQKTIVKEEAEKFANSINLLTKAQLRTLFPNSYIYTENFFGFTKSYIAISKEIVR